MLRPFLSLLVAGATTAVGASLALSTGARHRLLFARVESDASTDGLFLLGAGLLGVATASLAIHWLGGFVVGGIHVVLGGLAVLVPTGGLLSGAYSPMLEITSMLGQLNRDLGDGAVVFSFSGTQLVLGTFLVAAALAVRTRQDSPRPRARVATIASLVSVAALAGALALLLTFGDRFTALLLARFQYDIGFAAGVGGAALLGGIGGLCLRWASTGGVLVGTVAAGAGLLAFLAPGTLPFEFVNVAVVSHGFLLVLGLTVLVGALVAALAPRSAVPVEVEDL